MHSPHEAPLTPFQEQRAEDLAEQLMLNQFGPKGIRSLGDAHHHVTDTARRFGPANHDYHPYDAAALEGVRPEARVAGPVGAALLRDAAEHAHTPLVLTGKQAAFRVAADARRRAAGIRDTRIIMAHMRNPDRRYPDQE